MKIIITPIFYGMRLKSQAKKKFMFNSSVAPACPTLHAAITMAWNRFSHLMLNAHLLHIPP